MKPTTQCNKPSRLDSRESGSRSALVATHFEFQSSHFGGRCFGTNEPSFRSISQDYFKNEARQDYASEATLFGLIVLTVALPVAHSLCGAIHLLRVSGIV